MNGLFAFLIARWALSFIGTALLAALLWFFGPFLSLFEGWEIRVALIALMFLVWAGVNLFLDWRRRRRDAALAEGIAAPADSSALASVEEAAALQDKLSTALTLLRKARGTKGYLYEQPWYVIIGPPGAGKTTALLNAGLRFPLAAEMGQNAVAGVGGTRLCEWWFTEDAVLIDTAGRYTTQDSDAAVDRAGWDAFLALLKRTRARQPLNGVIVAIALTEIAGAAQGERLDHARAIRRRIKELEDRLAIRLPVYAVFTKADLLVGFTEFFDDLDREKRTQVWGTTLPLTDREIGPISGFRAEFEALVERLNSRLLERLQAERSPERRGLIAGFPSQFASMEAPLAEFLQEAFGGSRLDPAPMLRGVYVTSGTQEGTPIDRLTGVLSRAFGIDQRRAPSLRPEQGRSYFLGRLVREVIFGEAMLASERPGAARRRVLLRGGAFAAAAAAVIIIGGLLWHARSDNEQQIDELAAALTGYEQTAGGLPREPIADADMPRILPVLDQARALPHGYDDRKAYSSWLQLGLSQHAKLAAGAEGIYRHALERVLFPRLLWRLESQMHDNFGRPDFLYQATRVYLMLGRAGPLDRDLVRAWMLLDWQSRYPGAVMAPSREALARHLDVLLANPLPTVPLDDALVAAARATFSRVPPATRAYSLIAPSAAAQSIPSWRPADALGAGGVGVFVRATGKPLTEGIPGFYTVDGFHKVLLPALGYATKQISSESWVLGTRSELAPNSAEARRLEQDVIALYTADYAKQWDAMLTDLSVAPLRNPQQASQDLYLLASPQSPLRDLLASVARQLTLSQPPPGSPGAGATAAAGNAAATAGKQAAGQAATEAASNAARAVVPYAAQGVAQQSMSAAAAQLTPLLAAQAASPPVEPGKEIDERYRPLRDYVGSGPGAPIDQTLKAIDALRQQFAKLASPAAGGAPAAAPAVLAGDDPVVLLRAEATRAPQPVKRWLEAMITSGTAIRSGSTAEEVKKAFSAPGGPATLCQQAVAGRYPFSPGGTNDIPLDDFTKLLSPGGLLDGFFNTQLRPFVDMSGPVWRGQAVGGVPPPVSPAELAKFQQAAKIRDVFFAAGTTPTVRFDVTPVSLDRSATQVTLDLGGTTITYANGPPRATQVTWPGPNGMSTARLVFDPPSSGTTGVLQESGPWALFRLFERGQLKQVGSADRYQLTFRVGDREAIFELRAGSVLNPFTGSMLRGFQCPNI
jgi:type VI secretion system protein ImpL